MAKQIDLSGKLAQKATPKPAFDPAPPVGVNKMPLPPGELMKIARPTGKEAEFLASVGWKPGDPVPSNIADLIGDAAPVIAGAHASLRNVPPPVPLDTPPLQMPQEQSLNSMSSEKQREIMAALASAHEMEREEIEMRKTMESMPGPGVAAAVHAAQGHGVEVIDDTDDDTYAGTSFPKSKPGENTGSRPALEECPQCHHDLAKPVGAPPTDIDKAGFLQAMIGNIPYIKSQKLMGNSGLEVVFRQLTPVEVDQCWKQCYKQKHAGEFATYGDFCEELTRYRLVLQLSALRSNSALIHDLPDSIDGWVDSFKAAGVAVDSETVLPEIRDHVFGKILGNESLVRMLGVAMETFNDLVKQMEANVFNENFWQATSAAH